MQGEGKRFAGPMSNCFLRPCDVVNAAKVTSRKTKLLHSLAYSVILASRFNFNLTFCTQLEYVLACRLTVKSTEGYDVNVVQFSFIDIYLA